MINGIDSYAQQAQYAQAAAASARSAEARPTERREPDRDRDDIATARTQTPAVTRGAETDVTRDNKNARAIVQSANDSAPSPNEGAQRRGSLLDITV